jgi:hypothetical protein
MEMWQRYWSLKISWDFAVLGRVIRYKGRFVDVDVPSEGDRREVVICLTLITSNSRVTSPSEISFARVERLTLPVDSLYAEATEAVKSRAALSASTSELILT